MRTILILMVMTTGLLADDWPQWMGPSRDGVWREDSIIERFPDSGPKKLWTTKIGLGYAGPAVAGGRVFVTDRELAKDAKNPGNAFDTKTQVAGNERVLCFDSKNGQLIWKHEYDCPYRISYAAGPRCTPVVDDGRVYTLGAMGDLLCLNATNGEVIWRKNFVRDYDAKVPVWGFACHPLIDRDKLLCVGGGPGRLIIAFDKKTGREIWASETCEGDFGYGPPVIFEIDGVRQLIAWHASAIVCLDPENGQRRWSVPFRSQSALTVPMPRLVGADKLLFTSFYHGAFMLKATKNNAEFVWRSKARGERPNQTTDLSSIMGTPFIEGEHIYGVDSYGELRCLSLDGQRIWSSMKATRGSLTPANVARSPEPDPSERWSLAFIVKNGERFFLFNEQGDLIIAKLTPAGYEEISRAHLVDAINTMARRKVVWMHPAFADRAVYVRNDAEISAFSLAK